MTSLIRWAGSKRQLVPTLKTYWQKTRGEYHEPFLGSGSLFFSIEAPKAYLNDSNEELIHTYHTICVHPTKVHDCVSAMPVDEKFYYSLRSIKPTELGRIDRAARFLYLNRNCFNGVYRTNLQGEFNVPFSGRRTGALPSKALFQAAAKKLRTAELTCHDFEVVINDKVKAQDFVYLDPPYFKSGERMFRQYGPTIFSSEDLARLTRSVQTIAQRGAYFVLSLAKCEDTLKLFGDSFEVRELTTRSTIAGTTRGRKASQQVLITNCQFPDRERGVC